MSWYNKNNQFYDENVGSTHFERLAAAGLSRLVNHMLVNPYAIISGHTLPDNTERNRALNNESHKRLRKELHSRGYGFIDTKGAWRNEQAELELANKWLQEHPGETLPDDLRHKIFVKERSCFVPSITAEQAHELGRAFNQEAVITGVNGKYQIVGLKGEEPEIWGEGILDQDLNLGRRDLGSSAVIGTVPIKKPKVNERPVDSPTNIEPDIYTDIGGKRWTFTPPQPVTASIKESNRVCQAWYVGSGPHFYWPCTGVVSLQARLPISCLSSWVPFESGYELPQNKSGVQFAVKSSFSEWNKRSQRHAKTEVLEREPSVDETIPAAYPTAQFYVKRRDESEPHLQDVPLILTHDDYVQRLREVAKHSGDSGSCAHYIADNPYTAARQGCSSLWVDKNGTAHIVAPHTHTIAAYTLLSENFGPQGFVNSSKTLQKSDGNSMDQILTRASGFVRAQIYPDGIGVTIDLNNPPTSEQVRTMLNSYSYTTQHRFVAELYKDGELIGHAYRPAELLSILASHKSLASFADNPYVRLGSGKPSFGGRIG